MFVTTPDGTQRIVRAPLGPSRRGLAAVCCAARRVGR